MTLLTTIFAAVIATVVWYRTAPKSNMKLGTLSYVLGRFHHVVRGCYL